MSLMSAGDISHALSVWGAGLPEGAAWLVPVVLILLFMASLSDGRSGRVPDPLILGGVFLVLLVDGIYAGWPFAATHLAYGLIAAILLTTANRVWSFLFHQDVFGTGDAKWTFLAAMVFPVTSLVIAWLLATCVGIVWILTSILFRRAVNCVHFAPFLFFTLLIGLFAHLCPHALSSLSLPMRVCY